MQYYVTHNKQLENVMHFLRKGLRSAEFWTLLHQGLGRRIFNRVENLTSIIF